MKTAQRGFDATWRRSDGFYFLFLFFEGVVFVLDAIDRSWSDQNHQIGIEKRLITCQKWRNLRVWLLWVGAKWGDQFWAVTSFSNACVFIVNPSIPRFPPTWISNNFFKCLISLKAYLYASFPFILFYLNG